MKDNPTRVLVVDDEWIIRQQMSRALDMVGIKSDCAVNGEDALNRLVQCPYELVITDLRMPARNGHSLAVTLLSHPIRPKIVALTGVTGARVTRDLLERGVEYVVYKPVNYFQLAERIRSYIDQSDSKSTSASLTVANCDPSMATATSPVAKPRTIRTREQLELQLMQTISATSWISIALQSIEWHRITEPQKGLAEFMRKLSRPAPLREDSRNEVRASMNELAVAIEMNDHFEPLSGPFKLLIRDLSHHGIGLVHTFPVASHLAVMWQTKKNERVVAQVSVTRCKQFLGFYDIGGTFSW